MSTAWATPRSIVMVCQRCGGDMECISHGQNTPPRYVCKSCRALWEYALSGWRELCRSTVER